MRTNILILTLAIVLWSCGNNSGSVANLVESDNGLVYQEQVLLTQIGQIKLNLDNNTGFYHRSMSVTNIDGQPVLTFINRLNNTVYFYNLKSGELLNRLPLEIDGPNGVGQLSIADHLITPEGELLVYNVNTGVLNRLTLDGTLLRKYSLFDVRGEEEMSYPNPSNNRKMLLVGDDLHIPCEILSRKKDYSKTASLLTVNLSTGDSDYSLNFPDTYNLGYWGAIFKYGPSLAHDLDDGLIASYPIDPKVYKVGADKQLSEGTYVGSKYIEKLSPLTSDIGYGTRLDPNKRDQRSYEYSLTSSDYSRLQSDPYQEVYYRFVANRPRKEHFDSGDKSPEYSIIVMDVGFEKIGELRFDKKKYYPSMAVVTPEGLAIPRVDLYGQNEGEMVFDLFKVKSNQQALAVSH